MKQRFFIANKHEIAECPFIETERVLQLNYQNSTKRELP